MSPEAKSSVAVSVESLNVHDNLAGAPATLTTVDGMVFILPAHLREAAKRVVASGVSARGKRGRLPKILSDLDLAPPPRDPAIAPSSSSREALIAAVVESISGRLEENGAYQALVNKIAEHISSTVTLDQIAEVMAQDHREEVLAHLSESVVTRFCKRSA